MTGTASGMRTACQNTVLAVYNMTGTARGIQTACHNTVLAEYNMPGTASVMRIDCHNTVQAKYNMTGTANAEIDMVQMKFTRIAAKAALQSLHSRLMLHHHHYQ
ncbi:hypothetical protein CHS0354_003842 [Potamilus streckersoni]|uniref:Uncharacterized protein n=1 Tax=Potamilus streckersoni TaxID=2493646 RepID=A0AAE0VVZ7_9BIVA|nr:hypothetical protein CHS0354_003842 [Potamilus streckersoni]